MTIQDDETLRLYIEESEDHLTDIENDLLAIESAGAEIDEELVNKVFRAAHSIKGGAGFMGLNSIKELSHKMENVLGMIREREMIPNPEIVNILLLASDTLRNLIQNAESSNETDISEHVEALAALTTSSLPDNERDDVSTMIDISFPDGKTVFNVAQYDISNAGKKGNYIYLVEYDLIHDVHKKNRTPLDLLKKMEESGNIIDCKIAIKAVGNLEDDTISNRIPFLVLFATILEPEMVNALFEIDENNVFVLAEDMTILPVAQSSSAETIVIDEQESEILVEEPSPERPDIEAEESISAVVPVMLEDEKTEGVQKDKSVTGSVGSDTSLRVHVSLLDSLMTLAGELVLGRNQLLQAINHKDPRGIEASGQHLDLITSELQEAIMLTRMQPIGNVFNKFPRVVRDLARNLGKEVMLKIQGESVELDKTIIEAISDPLTHLVRNSVDHGIETPAERRKAGKDATGQVLLKAYHEAGQVNIEIRDDGRGIDHNKLASIAVSKNLISEKQVMSMSEKEKVNMIFLPGFSTAEKVSDVSGRGVGMDVVKTNLDKLGGVVKIDSQLGEGTTLRIKLPLTLAIIPSQIISVEGERYAIPQVNLEELFRIPAAQVRDRIEKVGDAEVVRLRGNLLPLIRLADVIGIERTYADPTDKKVKKDRRKNIVDRRSRQNPLFKEGPQEDANISTGDAQFNASDSQPEVSGSDSATPSPGDRRKDSDRRYHASSAINIVVVYTGALKYGLVVDELHDSEEIVVKPMGRHISQCKGYAGATIMGDGRVALILDVAGLSQMANLTSVEGTDRALDVAREQHMKTAKDVQSLLIFRNAEDEQFAVPLGLVERIEKIKRSSIEEVGGKNVIQYRGASLPLFGVAEVVNVKSMAETEELFVVIFVVAGKDIGLMATPPIDAIEESLVIDDTTLKQTGIMGSTIIGDHTTLIVDIFGLVKTLNPEWFDEREAVQTPDGKVSTILYVEDSNFFSNQVKKYMEDDGYKVIEAEDGMVAWDLMQEHGEEIALVVTDIEMPNLDGFGFVKQLKEDDRFSSLPVIALTTMASEEDIARGKEVGISDYQIKLDKEKLMDSIYNHLKKVN
ncbi:MAG: chemotaxis protein CheW [Deltaproteobacteria bacterium]|nr:chemotaxis protein CheW [Deltaproteobacteria bacterium]